MSTTTEIVNRTLRKFIAAEKTINMRLNLSSFETENHLVPSDVEALANILPLCKDGLDIDLSFGSIDDSGAKILFRKLKAGQCPSNLKLNLFSTGLTDAAIEVLIEVAGTLPPHLQLRLANNKISDGAFEKFTHALLPVGAFFDPKADVLMPFNKTLGQFITLVKSGQGHPDMKLDLSSTTDVQNKLNPTEIEALANILSLCQEGLQIDLRGGSIDEADVKTLLRKLKVGQCPSRLKIDLSGNKLSNAIIDELVAIAETFPSYLQLDLSNNKIIPEAFKILMLALPSTATFDATRSVLITSKAVPIAVLYADKMLPLIEKLLFSEKLTEEEKNALRVAEMRNYLSNPDNKNLANTDRLRGVQTIACEHLWAVTLQSAPRGTDPRLLFLHRMPRDPDTVFCKHVMYSAATQLEAFMNFINDRPAVPDAVVSSTPQPHVLKSEPRA